MSSENSEMDLGNLTEKNIIKYMFEQIIILNKRIEILENKLQYNVTDNINTEYIIDWNSIHYY
jgi:hypothetical protein